MLAKYRNCRFLLFAAAALAAFALNDADNAIAAGRLASFRAAKAANLAAANAATLNPSCAPPVACCPAPCITYRHHGPKICCGCTPPVETVLVVKDPCTCCPVQIPVCLPSCCTGEPTICCHKGFLGRDVVSYEWCCGFSVDIRFLRSGDIVVVTRGV